jgi:hypothetical protein
MDTPGVFETILTASMTVHLAVARNARRPLLEGSANA